jgi:hypothetical protein
MPGLQQLNREAHLRDTQAWSRRERPIPPMRFTESRQNRF